MHVPLRHDKLIKVQGTLLSRFADLRRTRIAHRELCLVKMKAESTSADMESFIMVWKVPIEMIPRIR